VQREISGLSISRMSKIELPQEHQGSTPVKVGHALVWDCLRDVDRFCGNLPKSANICLLDFLAETFGLEIDRSSKLAFWPPSFAHFSLVQISFPTSLTHTTDATRPSYKYRQMDPTFLSFFLPTHHHSPYSDIFPSRTPTLVKLLTS
jgi:hypothetical protein